MSALFEFCAFSLDDAQHASALGVDRIEFCRQPQAAGLTPTSADLVAASELLARTPIHPIVRTGSGFEVSEAELDLMCQQLSEIAKLGFPGAVVGALRMGPAAVPELDEEVALRCRAAAGSLELTWHRAFDQVADQQQALTQLHHWGFQRVLTSGGRGTAMDNLAQLRQLTADASALGMSVIAAGGITSSQIPHLKASGIREFHAAAGGSSGTADFEEVAHLQRQVSTD